jgi:hypothetical protein
LQYL